MEEQNTASLSVFVTGITEGLGKAVTRFLVAHGHTVAGAADSLEDANLIRGLGALPVYNGLFRASEIASTLKLTKADVLVNTTPQVINGLPLHNPDWDYYTRLLTESTAACVEAAEQTGVKFIVHTSYAFLYGDTHGEPVDESARITTEAPVFKAAAAAEKAVLNAQVPGCVLRAGYNYGAENASLKAIQKALIGKGSMLLGKGDASWIHTSDLVAAIVAAVEQQPAGEIFNIVDDTPVSPGTFVDHLADSMGVKHPSPSRMPEPIMNLTVPVTTRALMNTSFKAANAKARKSLNWSPQFASYESGIEQTLLNLRATEAG
jgi:nucleoside-diphosphate-sugar epimerase